jgi:hypothetical protein
MDQILSAVTSECQQDQPPYPAPVGLVWFKEPDEYDRENGVVWEGNWTLVSAKNGCGAGGGLGSKTKSAFYKQISDYCHNHDHDHNHDHNRIQIERKAVENTFCPEYHVCKHKSHKVCTNSSCCDLFWHDDDCDFVSDFDGKQGGYAWRNGNQ